MRYLSQLRIPTRKRLIVYKIERDEEELCYKAAREIYRRKLSEWKLMFYFVDVQIKIPKYPLTYSQTRQ